MLAQWAQRRVWRSPPEAIWLQRTSRSFYQQSSPRSQVLRRQGIHAKPHPRLLRAGHQLSARALFTSSIPPILIPPAIFTGLLITLWTWKCFWIVVLQDKLLYLSWLPPFSRSETIANYEPECRPVNWTERPIRSLDGTRLTVCEGRIPAPGDRGREAAADPPRKRKSVVICYFQGNGGSTPLRLPLLSHVLRAIRDMSSSPPGEFDVEYTVVALSYRGYWTSSGRATQRGIELDAQALLEWVSQTFSAPDKDLQLVLWGHSLGAAVASKAALAYLSRADSPNGETSKLPIAGLVLEAPISSIKDMLISLYPQKWLPYRYLWPFSWNNWDVASYLEQMAHWQDRPANPPRENHMDGEAGSLCSQSAAPCSRALPPIFLMSAKEDEVIPPWVADQLEQKAKDLKLDLERKDVPGAMHIEGPLKVDGRKALVNFILKRTARRATDKSLNKYSTH
ncbi:hypothetical protein ARAM_002353 [Aspergillus rambellii]|uniref:AB hydrolase-1 domain-containing protein n=1 Tax=Aspergillus rambellii TaxID=308745 RepID=A0A0F8UYC6_9EURO|nr:hypothetical protein ARAM_002353 [Aspergillus rambellii]